MSISSFTHATRRSMTPLRCSVNGCFNQKLVIMTKSGALCNAHRIRLSRYGRLHKKAPLPHHHERRAWANMNSRCNNRNTPGYHLYGGRGIEVRYSSFEAFFSDIGPRPSVSHSVDRINTNGHYEPGNCRWATKIEQGNNVRRNVVLTMNGLSMTISEWARRGGIKVNTLQYRLRRGWDLERALTEKVNDKLICA